MGPGAWSTSPDRLALKEVGMPSAGLDVVTSSPASPAVELAEIGGIGQRLGVGGQAEVLELAGHNNVVFKRYHRGHPVDGAALDRLILWRASTLTPEDRAYLDQRCCWPIRRVLENGATAGVILQRIPPAFMATLKSRNTKPRELSFLFLPDRAVKVGVVSPPPSVRARFLADLAGMIDFLGRNRIAHGDISMKNVLWDTPANNDEPFAFLLDCDGVLLGRDRALHHVATPGWADPRLGQRSDASPDRESDLYALGLAVYRCYFAQRGQLEMTDSSLRFPTTPPSPPEFQRSLARALSHRSGRTPAKVWQTQLLQLADALGDDSQSTPLSEATRDLPKPGRGSAPPLAGVGSDLWSAPVATTAVPMNGANNAAAGASSTASGGDAFLSTRVTSDDSPTGFKSRIPLAASILGGVAVGCGLAYVVIQQFL